MNIEWVQPVTFKKKKHDWVGQIELQGTSVEIVCKHIWGSKPRDGIVAGDVFVRKIERAILKAIDYCDESTLSVLSEALGELYNQHWRPKGGRNIKPDKLTTELKLARIDFSLNSRWADYRLRFAPIEKRFRGYIPCCCVDRGKVSYPSLDCPRDENWQPTLPYLEDMQEAKLPRAASDRLTQKVPLTEQTKNFKWVAQLSFDAKGKQWIDGEIVYQRKRYEIKVNASKKDDPESWVDLRLSRILAQLSAATKEASHQLAELYNDSWMEDRELSATGVKRRIKLESLTLNRDESWQMWFADGDLFGGHWIDVSIDTNGEVTQNLCG